MKGFNTSDGYMGLVEGRYILFASESDYYEYMNDQSEGGNEMFLPGLVVAGIVYLVYCMIYK